jgi:hypothetical protein
MLTERRLCPAFPNAFSSGGIADPFCPPANSTPLGVLMIVSLYRWGYPEEEEESNLINLKR